MNYSDIINMIFVFICGFFGFWLILWIFKRIDKMFKLEDKKFNKKILKEAENEGLKIDYVELKK